MKKVFFALIFCFSFFAVSCVSERGDVLFPPKYVEIHVVSGKVNFSTEIISYTSFNRRSIKAGDFQENPDTVFGYNPGNKAQMNNVMTLGAGEVYEVLIPVNHTANVYIKPVLEDCVVTYKERSQEYSIELSKNDIFGKVIKLEF
ncbi:MAG: hypothetical protein MJ182_09820 [Treponema sp.]|nr:hypothetical protein [Treponema sp.]